MRKEMGQYRGRRVDGQGWLHGSLINNAFYTSKTGKPCCYILDTDEDYDCWEDIVYILDEDGEVDPETVGQQTPFADRFGQPIFEGMHVKTRSLDYIHCMDSGLIAMDPDGQWVISKHEDEIHGMPINWDGFDSIEIIKD